MGSITSRCRYGWAWIPACPVQAAQGAWEPVAPQLSQREGWQGAFLSFARLGPPRHDQRWGALSQQSRGPRPPSPVFSAEHERPLPPTVAARRPQPASCLVRAELLQRNGEGACLPQRVLLGPGATLLCTEDQQHDAGGRSVLPLWPVAMRPTGHPTPQARCRPDSAGTSGGRRLQSHRDDCQAAWSHDPPLPHGQAFHLFIKPGFQ